MARSEARSSANRSPLPADSSAPPRQATAASSSTPDSTSSASHPPCPTPNKCPVSSPPWKKTRDIPALHFIPLDFQSLDLPISGRVTNSVGVNLYLLLGCVCRKLLYRRMLRQLPNKFRLPGLRLESNIAAKMFGYNFVRDAESQSCANPLGFAGEERLEDMSSIFCRNSGAVVTNAHQNITALDPGSHDDVSLLRRRIYCIVQQVHPHLVQPGCRCLQNRHIGAEHFRHLNFFVPNL